MPNAISITRRHFSDMEHLGDITVLDGSKLPPVDIIAFGSPCQSWSIAGNRTGLDGQSGLFFEAIRIIREMRKATNGKYPQIAIFENVPGLLSCGAGGRSNYQTVLEAFCEAEIPMPKSGRWAKAGMVRGRGIDFAWVIKDAQYYRTAQRRKRLFAVVDFGGQRAGEILFVSKSLSGYFEARREAWKGVAADFEGSTGIPITVVNDQGGESLNIEMKDISPTLRSEAHGNLPIVCSAFMAGQSKDAGSIGYSEIVSPTLKGSPSGTNQTPCVCIPDALTMRLREGCSGGGKGPLIQSEKSGTLATGNDQYVFCVVRQELHPDIAGTLCASGAGLSRPAGNNNETDLSIAYCLQGNMIGRQDKNGPQGSGINEELCFTISATDHHGVATFSRQRCDSYKQDNLASTQTARQYKEGTDLVCKGIAASVDCRNLCENSEVSGTLQSKCNGGYSLNYQNPVRVGYVVRRLTPKEAERLMSFPDSWTEYGHDGKQMSDSARYQMCGNSIVVNVLSYIFQNIAELLSK